RGDSSGQNGGAGFADVKAPRTRLVGIVVIDQPREILRIHPRQPYLFQRPCIAPAWSDIHETETVGAEQPFVSRSHHEIGLDGSYIERQSAKRLSDVQGQDRSLLPASMANGL